MKNLKLSQDWLVKLLPEGLPYPASTIISGPGGSGKPLIGFAFVSDWLKAGGSVIFIALQYPEAKFVKASLNKIYNINVDEYSDKIAYIQFNHGIDSWENTGKNTLDANLLKPDIWEESVNKAEGFFSDIHDPGVLVFASALNLLLFSPTYRKLNLDKFVKLLSGDKRRTYIFSVSTSAFREGIERWEKSADNVMFARIEEEMKLYLRLEKMNGKDAVSDEIPVPIKRETLEEIKDIAESVRKRQIPELRKI